MNMVDFNLIPILPELFLAICAMGLLIVGVVGGNRVTSVISWASVIVLLIAGAILSSISWAPITILNGMFTLDAFSAFMKLLILLGVIASIALSVRYLEEEALRRFEYPILVLMAGLGMMLMVSANNFLSLYMALELQSLSLYVLASFHRHSLKSAEAGVKYFILGALSSGMLLFGISMIYGFTGSLDFQVVGSTVSALDQPSLGLIVGLVFILAGLAFKISAVPFHMWTPDVYQGAPTSVTAFFAIVPKVAAMALLIRVLFDPFFGLIDQWMQIIFFISVGSMLLGAFAGIAQDNIKRLIAYSSIGNMGYALIGVAAGTSEGVAAVILYLLIYMVMTVGVFVVIMSMRRNGRPMEKISDLRGISETRPYLAYAMAILMFSMSGIPPMAGFFGKLMIFQVAVEQGLYVLAVIGLLASVVAAFYYLRVIKVMFFEPQEDALDRGMPFVRRVLLLLSVLFVVGFAVKPSLIVESTQSAASALFLR